MSGTDSLCVTFGSDKENTKRNNIVSTDTFAVCSGRSATETAGELTALPETLGGFGRGRGKGTKE